MTSRARGNLFLRENKAEIKVESTDDGDHIVTVTNTCLEAIKFVEGLGPLSLTDLSDRTESKIYRKFITSDVRANCLLLP